jgi:hypothetical protein
MRLLTLPVTIVRVPIELGFGAAKGAVKLAQDLVGGGEETVAQKPRRQPAQRRRPARRSTNGGSGTTSSRASRSRRSASRTSAAASTASATRPAPGATGPAAAEPAPPGPAPETAAAAAEPAPPGPAPEAAAAAEAVAPPEPAHVSEEPELVAEAAERGAEDGAGAEVAVDEPWPGYDEMQAADIQDRLVTENAETAAAVSLYEASRKGRADVLEAASRHMVS